MELSKYLYDNLSTIPGITIYGPTPGLKGEDRASLCSFNIDGFHATDIATVLDLEVIRNIFCIAMYMVQSLSSSDNSCGYCRTSTVLSLVNFFEVFKLYSLNSSVLATEAKKLKSLVQMLQREYL